MRPLAYLLVGQTNVGRKRVERLKAAFHDLPRPQDAPGWPAAPETAGRHEALFAVGRSISGYEPVGGNSAVLMENSDEAIDGIVADIGAAGDQVHLLFYIWLADRNGTKVAEGKSPGLIPKQPADGFSVGSDVNSAVGEYRSPHALPGTVTNVRVDWLDAKQSKPTAAVNVD